MKRLFRAVLLAPIFCALPVMAHHGVAGVGAAAIEGPGSPVESASSAVLPVGKTLLYAKLDHAKFKTYDPDPANPESDYANYWMVGLGHGFTPGSRPICSRPTTRRSTNPADSTRKAGPTFP